MEVRRLRQFDKNALKEMMELDPGVRVSLIMPVQQEPDKRDENHIRLKNLIDEAEGQLAKRDFRKPDIEQLLAPAVDMVKGGRFLETGAPGLALYLTEGYSRAYQLPESPFEAASVGPIFQAKPLIHYRNGRHFFILVLSQQHVRLLRASPYETERLDLQHLPGSLDEALRWDDPEKQLQWHSRTGTDDDGRAAMFHGHGVAAKETEKEELLRYFQLLNRGVERILAQETAPMILAGVDYLLPIYRQASSYNFLLDDVVHGNQEHLADREILRQAWPLAEVYFRADQQDDMKRYQQLAGSGSELASSDPEVVVAAAHHGRVDTLFAALDAELAGSFDEERSEVIVGQVPGPATTDLLNLASIYSVLNDGQVHLLSRSNLPDWPLLAAIFRY